MNILDKWAINRVSGKIKTYANSGSLTTYDRAFSDFIKQFGLGGADEQDYVGAVFNAIEVHAFYYTKTKFRLYKRKGNTNEEVLDHKFLNLFESPNSVDTWWKYAYLIATGWGLWGVNYFHIKRNIISKEPFAYQWIPPSLVEKKKDSNGQLIGYIYNDGTNQITLKLNDIIKIPYPNPYSPDNGLAIVSTVAPQKVVNALQMQYMKKFFENGGFMGLVFTTTQTMTPANFKRTLEMLEQKFKGADKAYDEVGVFDSGLQPQKAAYSINDMDITNSRKLTKEDIYEAWKVADIMVGRGNMDRAGNEAAIFQFTSGIADPLMNYLDSIWSLFVNKEWGSRSKADYATKDKFSVIHDTLAPKDVAATLKFHETMQRLGNLTGNQVLEAWGYNRSTDPLMDTHLVHLGGGIMRLDTGKQVGVENTPSKQ